MNYLGRVTVETSKRSRKPIEKMVYENDAVHIDDNYNKNLLTNPAYLTGLENTEIDNFSQNFEPENMQLDGGEQMLNVSFRDAGVTNQAYQISIYLEVEEEFEINE